MWEAAWDELEALPTELKNDLGVLTCMQILVGLNEHRKASFIGLTHRFIHPHHHPKSAQEME